LYISIFNLNDFPKIGDLFREVLELL